MVEQHGLQLFPKVQRQKMHWVALGGISRKSGSTLGIQMTSPSSEWSAGIRSMEE